MQLKNWHSFMKLLLSSSVPGRRPRSRSEQLGGPPTGPNVIQRPPMRTSCAGLRAWRVNSAGWGGDGLDLIVRQNSGRLQRELGLRPGQLVDRLAGGAGTAATPFD